MTTNSTTFLPMHRLRLLLFSAAFTVSSISLLAQSKVPGLGGHRIHDLAGILSPQTIAMLERSLQSFEDSTSNQIAVLIVNSLAGESIDQFGIRVAESWKLGQKDKDNGVILLVAVEDRKVRIEVGQGLEGPLPDAISNRIIRNEMAPSFRRGDYDTGVIASIDAIRKAIKGEYTGTGPARKRKGGSPSWLVILMIIIFVVMRSRGGNRGRGRGSGMASGAGWFLAGALGGSMRGGGGGGGSWGGGGGFGGGGSSGSW